MALGGLQDTSRVHAKGSEWGGGGHQDHELKLKHRASMRLSVLQRKCRAIMQKATVRLTNHGQNRWGATKGLATMVNGGPET